jgi:hypothetical protein
MHPLPDPVRLFGPEMRADPYPLYHQLRSVDHVDWSARHNAWIVTGYDALAAGLLDLRLSSEGDRAVSATRRRFGIRAFFRLRLQTHGVHRPADA